MIFLTKELAAIVHSMMGYVILPIQQSIDVLLIIIIMEAFILAILS